jgi:hypothetical protein
MCHIVQLLEFLHTLWFRTGTQNETTISSATINTLIWSERHDCLNGIWISIMIIIVH